jgi:DNA ligase-1
MPKGMRSAPPQQSSLLEMWKGGKRKAVDDPKKSESVMVTDTKEENNLREVKLEEKSGMNFN